MKKVKFNFKKVENSIIKIDDQEVEMKGYISTEDALAITKLCLDYFENNGIESFPVIRLVYDMAVTELCTNISFDGIKSKTVKGVKTVSLNLDADKIEKFENCEVRNHLWGIAYYDEIYESIINAIELKNVYMAINGLANSIPDPNNMTEALSQVMREFKKAQDKDPELVDIVVKDEKNRTLEKIIKE